MNAGSQYSIHSVCRICLNDLRNDATYDLFMVPGLAKKLCLCTSLSVEHQDGFPKNLCTTCYTRLNDMHDFQKLCVDSVAKFQEMVANNTFTCLITDIDNQNGSDAELGGDDEDQLNFDPLLNHKMEMIETEEDVFKMLETVDKEAEKVENEVNKAAEAQQAAEEQHEVKKMFPEESSCESGNDIDNDIDFEPDSSDDDMPLAARLRGGKLKTPTKLMPDKKPKSKSDKSDNEFSSSSSEDDDDDDDEFEDDVGGTREKPKRKRIPAAERHLHRLIDCHICHQKFKKAIRYEEHMKYHNDLLPFQCKVETCKKGFTTANGLRLHVDHTHTELAEVHTCIVEGCGKTFPRIRLLTFHLKKVHSITKQMVPPRDYPCTECEKVFKCPTALKKHMYKHDGKELPFPCNICGKRFAINSSLKDHLMRHAGIKNYVCPYCGAGKTTRQEWNQHLLTHTKEKKFKCTYCDHASHNRQSLSNHIKVVHHGIKKFACRFCGHTFGKSHACKVHERIHTSEKCVECKICGRVFSTPKGLTRHSRSHEKEGLLPKKDKKKKPELTEEEKAEEEKARNMFRVERVDISQLAGTSVNPIPSVSVPSWSPQVNFEKKEGQHICPGCGRGFNNIGNMKLHYKIIHLKIKDFACRFCPKRFSKAHILRHHEYIHTGEKPYECKVCGTHFRHETALRKHMRVHENRPRKQRVRKPKDSNAPREKRKRIPKKKEIKPLPFEAELDPEQIEEKRKADEEKRKVQEAAYNQLQELQKQQEIEKAQSTYDGYFAQKAEAEGISLDVFKLDHV